MAEIPALTGRQLISLLMRNGWVEQRRANHGVFLVKLVDGRRRTALVKDTSRDIPRGTLSAILSSKQTGLGRAGLLRLMER